MDQEKEFTHKLNDLGPDILETQALGFKVDELVNELAEAVLLKEHQITEFYLGFVPRFQTYRTKNYYYFRHEDCNLYVRTLLYETPGVLFAILNHHLEICPANNPTKTGPV